MDDPRRIVGRENDVRIDAVLVQDTVSPGSIIGVTYQIQNFSDHVVAVAPKIATATYDAETRTITLSVGAEVPQDGKMPQVVTIAPGEKKIFRGGATPAITPGAIRAEHATPGLVQVKVTVLRDVDAFANVTSGQLLSDAQFDQWFESNETIFLNTVPVRFSTRGAGSANSAERRDASSAF
jgi:hypothetical protein